MNVIAYRYNEQCRAAENIALKSLIFDFSRNYQRLCTYTFDSGERIYIRQTKK